MKKLFILGLGVIFSLAANGQTLEERVEALEFAGYEDIFKFSGILEMEYSTIASKNNDTDVESSGQGFKSWMKLDASSKPSDRLQFFGRLSMAKYMNRMSAYTDGTFGDIDGQLDEGQLPKGSEVYFERAFVNYSFSDKLVFTFGRLPTANGTPYHLTRDEASQGAYPFLSYNGFFDGMALSYGVTKNLSAKLIYTPFQFTDNTTTTSGGEVDSPTNTFSFMLDYESLGQSWTRRLNLVYHYIRVQNVQLGLQDLDNAGNATGVQSDFSFDLTRHVIAAEMNGISGSKFDLGIQFQFMSHVTNDGFIVPDGVGGTTDAYFLSEDGEEETSTIGILTARYGINENNKIGIQYYQASQYAFASDVAGKTPIGMFSDPGTGYHLFYNHNFGGGLKMNIGAMQTQQNYEASTGVIFGDRVDADITNEAGYVSFVAYF